MQPQILQRRAEGIGPSATPVKVVHAALESAFYCRTGHAVAGGDSEPRDRDSSASQRSSLKPERLGFHSFYYQPILQRRLCF